jgi:hypothetical protein
LVFLSNHYRDIDTGVFASSMPELAELEEKLLVEDNRANGSDDTDEWAMPRSWYKLRSTKSPYLNLVLEIRAKLHEYSVLFKSS